MENNYSNIIAPSDGVRRFLCKTSVLVASIMSVVFCVCAFRMNMLEANALGGSLRSSMLYAAYIMLPLGLLTAAIFARIKAMGLAFSMISLLVAMTSAFMLLLNSLASLLRESRMLGISGSLLEFLTFGAFFALLVNLVMSCMEFRLQPVIGLIGALAAACAMILTSTRTILSFSALSFAWKPEFEWSNLGKLVDTDKLRYHAGWIFRSIPKANADALHNMFELRLYERVSACLFYGVLIMIFLKYKKEMKAFNKLLAHAGEYVDIPTARIYRNIFGSGARNDGEPAEDRSVRHSGSSLQTRLRALSNMTRAREQGMDITEMADDYDAHRVSENKEFDYTPDNRLEYSDEDELTEAERLIMERRHLLKRSDGNSGRNVNRRRPEESGYDERRSRRQPEESGYEERRSRRQPEEFRDEERRSRRQPEQFRNEEHRSRRQPEESGYEERRSRRQPEKSGYEERRSRRQPEESGYEERRSRRQPVRELTDQEKYIMEERRKRQSRMNPDGSDGRTYRTRGGNRPERY